MNNLAPGQMPTSDPLPFVPKINDKRPLRAELTYFFERDKRIIATSATDGWAIYSGKLQTIGAQPSPTKYIGRSTGEIYLKAIKDSHKLYKETGDFEKSKEILAEGMKAELKKARKDKTPPRNLDQMDRNGNPIDIRTLGQFNGI